MSNAIELVPQPADLVPAGPRYTLLEAFLAGRKPTTARTYAAHIHAFTGHVRALAWPGCPTDTAAVDYLIGLPRGDAFALVAQIRATTLTTHSRAYVKGLLATVRGVVECASELGLIPWTLPARPLRVETDAPSRDTLGPGRQAVTDMLALVEPSARDTALIALLAFEGLRKAEALALDVEHIDAAQTRLFLLAKGAHRREWVACAPRTIAALVAWIEERGADSGPLFPGRGATGRLTGTAVWYLVRRVGARVGVVARPHGLRHTAITTALDVTTGDKSAAQYFSRHADPRMLERYDDSHNERRRRVARLVSNAY